MAGADEFSEIAALFRPLTGGAAGAFDLLDDAALVPQRPGFDLVVTKDAMVEGVHAPVGEAPDLFARKLLRVNLSDLAAKGAKPAGFLLSLALPKPIDDAWLQAFARGLEKDADAFDCPLLGGDTDRTPGPVTVSITVFGTLPQGTMVPRSGARAGQRVCVTGTIGDAALGLLLRRDRRAAARLKLARARQQYLLARYLLPQPRNALAEAVRLHASAAMDVSDGLVGDFSKLCAASRVSARVEASCVPLSGAAERALAAEPALIERLLTGGDDYEIVCTVPPKKVAAFQAAVAKARVPLAEIGVITKGRAPPCFFDASGESLTFKQLSFSHF